jgi:hypothetical protein
VFLLQPVERVPFKVFGRFRDAEEKVVEFLHEPVGVGLGERKERPQGLCLLLGEEVVALYLLHGEHGYSFGKKGNILNHCNNERVRVNSRGAMDKKRPGRPPAGERSTRQNVLPGIL